MANHGQMAERFLHRATWWTSECISCTYRSRGEGWLTRSGTTQRQLHHSKAHPWIGDDSHKLYPWGTIHDLQALDRPVSPPGRVAGPRVLLYSATVYCFYYLERSLTDLLSFSIRVFTSWVPGASFLPLRENSSVQKIITHQMLKTFLHILWYWYSTKGGCGWNWQRIVPFLRDMNKPLSWDDGRKFSMWEVADLGTSQKEPILQKKSPEPSAVSHWCSVLAQTLI